MYGDQFGEIVCGYWFLNVHVQFTKWEQSQVNWIKHTASNPSFRFSLNFVTKESMSLFLATSYKVKKESN